ncbi:MAG: hypothetical protein IIB85_02925, partial [Chloroflexi bacterium]|nr:hypothetical protein [Chloroflexota bacterium]
HKNLEPAAQAAEVRKVKKFESGMVVDPMTIRPNGERGGARRKKGENILSDDFLSPADDDEEPDEDV